MLNSRIVNIIIVVMDNFLGIQMGLEPNSEQIENNFLGQLQQQNTPVSIYLKNGIQLKGHVESFDDAMVILKSQLAQVVVYKHAISTVMQTPEK